MSSASASSPSGSPTAAERKARVTNRQKIEQLQKEAERLSLELLAAKRLASERASSRAETPAADGVWEAVAERQKQRRERAEQENVQLRKLVLAQARHLRGLRELVVNRPFRTAVDEHVRVLAGRTVPRAPMTIGEQEADFHSMLAFLNREHARVDALWAGLKIDQLPLPSHRWMSTRESSVEHKQFALVSRTVVPFPVDAVQEACWARLMDPPLRNPSAEYYLLLQQQGDTIQLVLSTVDNDFKIKQKFCAASRRFVERNRFIIGTTAISEPRGAIDMASLGIKVQSTVLRVFREGERLPTGDRSTIVEVIWGARGLNLDGVTQCSTQEFENYVDAGRAIIYNVMKTELNAIEEFLLTKHLPRSTRVDRLHS